MKIKFLLLASLILWSFSSLFAQTAKTAAYQTGERLSYAVKFSKAVLRGIEVADLNFVVEQSAGDKNYLIRAAAESKGTLSALFNLEFKIDFESTLDGERFQILKTVKRDEQGERIRASEANFDYATKKVIYSETDPTDAARPPRRAASTIEADTQDLISAIYALRRLPLVVGKTFEMKVSDSGLVYKIPVRVAARELQKTAVGKIWCFRLEPQIFGKNRLIEKQGTMFLWISEDARRLPVRAQINYDIGRIEVKIKKTK